MVKVAAVVVVVMVVWLWWCGGGVLLAAGTLTGAQCQYYGVGTAAARHTPHSLDSRTH